MTEEYLHFIWSLKRIVATELKTQDNELIQISSAGLHNAIMAGPDFSHAKLNIDGLEWHGPVEIHVKSSDWYAHKHDIDEAYNNVILHVVYEHDKEVVQNGRKLPTLELKPFIDWDHFEQFERFKKSKHDIHCAASIKETNALFIDNMMEKALLQKWDQKMQVLQEYINDRNDAMITFLGAAFGGHLNMHPFLQTLATVPADRLRKMAPMKRYNLLLTQSGIIFNDSRTIDRWHFKGNRPGNFPSKRLYQFAFFMHDDQLKLLAELADPKDVIERFDEIMKPKTEQLRLTDNFKHHILINAVVPFFYYSAQQEQNEQLQEFAMELLRLLPPEKNNITRKWTAIESPPKNAWESQGLLALYRYYCKAKKCLSCEVGNAIIERSA
ncbi:MAG: DUF2851 family protein [bacterium]|nr:DUF2851 family protein [bacterium]